MRGWDCIHRGTPTWCFIIQYLNLFLATPCPSPPAPYLLTFTFLTPSSLPGQDFPYLAGKGGIGLFSQKDSLERLNPTFWNKNLHFWSCISKLEAAFLSTHYPDVIQREMLAKRVQLKEERIEVAWNYHFTLVIIIIRSGSRTGEQSGGSSRGKLRIWWLLLGDNCINIRYGKLI